MKKTLLIALLTITVSGLTAYTVAKLSVCNSNKLNASEQGIPIQKTGIINQSYPDLTFAAEHSVKAVVHVKVLKKGYEEQYSIFDFFFGNSAPNQIPREQVGSGSGVIITSDGYIITNNHVVEGAQEISVTLDNNKTYNAKISGKDAVTDIALLKIEAKDLPFLTFGNSDSLRLGEWVLAIGNPYNLRSTVTAGIVSAKSRSIPSMGGDDFKIESFIQTDAAVNPGNSGGALINTKGELIGINTAIASRTGSYAGYSFAVPTTIAKKIVEDIIDYGKVHRALLGISMKDIDANGVLVVDIQKGGAADIAGVKASDILISINGVEVNSAPAVQEQISKYRPNDKINLRISRNNKQIDLKVVLHAKGDELTNFSNNNTTAATFFGAQLQNASEVTMKKLGISFGVQVVFVDEGKFKSTGIKKGFIITHINQIPVRNIQDLSVAMQKSRRAVLIEGIYQDGSTVYYGMGL